MRILTFKFNWWQAQMAPKLKGFFFFLMPYMWVSWEKKVYFMLEGSCSLRPLLWHHLGSHGCLNICSSCSCQACVSQKLKTPVIIIVLPSVFGAGRRSFLGFYLLNTHKTLNVTSKCRNRMAWDHPTILILKSILNLDSYLLFSWKWTFS